MQNFTSSRRSVRSVGSHLSIEMETSRTRSCSDQHTVVSDSEIETLAFIFDMIMTVHRR